MASVELTSGASGRIIPVFRNFLNAVPSHRTLLKVLILLRSLFLGLFFLFRFQALWIFSFFQSRDNRMCRIRVSGLRLKADVKKEEEEEVTNRRVLAERVEMVIGGDEEEDVNFVWSTSEFVNSRGNSLFVRSWMPAKTEKKGILIIIHGLNEHGGRYAYFAKQLTEQQYGVYAMDWIGHGGSDGLHGYVPSLDFVVADTMSFLAKVKLENPSTPCFLFGHSTGGAVVLKATSYPEVEEMLQGVILTSPALRVNPKKRSFLFLQVIAPLISAILPKFQIKGAVQRVTPVTRDPEALIAKYSDPLVYTGPIRARTAYEILRITSYLQQNMSKITAPFLVLHGTADKVTDPIASKELHTLASSKHKDLKLYVGFLHDLLFEPERDEIAAYIINWMTERIQKLSS